MDTKDFEGIFDKSELLNDIEERFIMFCQLIEDRFPKYSCLDKDTDDYLEIDLDDRPLEKGLGWTQHSTEGYRLGKVLFSNYIDSLDSLHFDSVIAHEVAHIAAYNELWSGDVKANIKEWKETGGHTKVWHEIVDKLNNTKLKSGEKAFDIVEKLDNDSMERYFPEND